MVDVAGTLDIVTTAIISIVVIGTLSVLLFWVWQVTRYKTLVIIRDVVKGRSIIMTDKARRIKDKNSNYWWKLLKEKVRIPEPPEECIETTSKGKKFAEFFKLKDSGYFPAKSTNGYVSVRSQITEDMFKDRMVEGFEPLTTQERALYTYELKESEKYKQASRSEMIAKAIPYVALILILTVLLLFAGEFFSPLFEQQQKMETLQQMTWEKIEGVIDKLDMVIDDKQSFVAAGGGTNSSGPPN